MIRADALWLAVKPPYARDGTEAALAKVGAVFGDDRQQLGRDQIRPIAIGRNNWPFAGGLRADTRAAAIMSLIRSALRNGHDPCACPRDILERPSMRPASRIDELLPHHWRTTAPV